MKNELDLDTLHELLEYNADTGELRWKPRHAEMFSSNGQGSSANCKAWNTKHAGKRALNTLNDRGYHRGMILGKQYRAGQVCFAMSRGHWPVGEIDHINHVRTDDRAVNLRDVPHAVNARNLSRAKNNRSGYSGIYWDASDKKWVARIKVNRKIIHLGRYENIELAAFVRREAEQTFGFHPNHGKEKFTGRGEPKPRCDGLSATPSLANRQCPN